MGRDHRSGIIGSLRLSERSWHSYAVFSVLEIKMLSLGSKDVSFSRDVETKNVGFQVKSAASSVKDVIQDASGTTSLYTSAQDF